MIKKMAKLDLNIKAELSHIQLHAVVKTQIGDGDNIELNTFWLENLTVEQFEKMIELYESFVDNSIPPKVGNKNFEYGNDVMNNVKGGK